MFCPNCGKEVQKGAKFCFNCGTALISEKSPVSGTVLLSCKYCHGTMTVKEGTNILYCPYCGAAEMMLDSENIALEKIRSKTYADVEKYKYDVSKDVEIEKLKYEQEKTERALQQETVHEFKKSSLRRLVIIFAIVCGIITVVRIRDKNMLGALIPGLQTILFFGAWLMGMGTFRSKRPALYRAIALLGFLLIIPLVSWNIKPSPKVAWPSSGLATKIPEPPVLYGEIWHDDRNSFRVKLQKWSPSRYKSYENKCKEAGFVIEGESTYSGYDAFNEDGIKLSLDYNKSGKELSINVAAPRKMRTFQWPDSDIVALLPVPESDYGAIMWNRSNGFAAFIGNTTKEQLREFFEKCRDRGFDLNVSTNDNHYQADNQDSYHLSVNYQGFNTMFINIKAPDEKASSGKSKDAQQ